MTPIRLVFFNDCSCGCDCGCGNEKFDGDVLLIMDIEYLKLLVDCSLFSSGIWF